MLITIESFINRINEWLGRTVAWFILAMVIVTFFNVVMRYGFNFGLIAIQESVIYFHSFVFMLAIAYTYKHNEHVRVDIFYSKYSNKQKAWVDLMGTLLLLIPFCLYLIFSSWEYAAKSWALLEGSREAGGLPILFILKTLVPLMPTLLLLQGIATACNSINTLTTKHSG
jgi:TRAP-type mannitol/chloroaromatic compound transport system permease small subunit